MKIGTARVTYCYVLVFGREDNGEEEDRVTDHCIPLSQLDPLHLIIVSSTTVPVLGLRGGEPYSFVVRLSHWTSLAFGLVSEEESDCITYIDTSVQI